MKTATLSISMILLLFSDLYAADAHYSFNKSSNGLFIEKYENGQTKELRASKPLLKSVLSKSENARSEFSLQFGVSASEFSNTLNGTGSTNVSDINLYKSVAKISDQMNYAKSLTSPSELCIPTAKFSKELGIIIETNANQLTVAPTKEEVFVARAFNSFYQPISIRWASDAPYPNYAHFGSATKFNNIDFFTLFDGMSIPYKGSYTDANTRASSSQSSVAPLKKTHSKLFRVVGVSKGQVSVTVGKAFDRPFQHSGVESAIDPAASKDVKVNVDPSASDVEDNIVKYVHVNPDDDELGVLREGKTISISAKLLSRSFRSLQCSKYEGDWSKHGGTISIEKNAYNSCKVSITAGPQNKSHQPGDELFKDDMYVPYPQALIRYTVTKNSEGQRQVTGGTKLTVSEGDEADYILKVSGPLRVTEGSTYKFSVKVYDVSRNQISGSACKYSWVADSKKFEVITDSDPSADQREQKFRAINADQWRKDDQTFNNQTVIAVIADCNGKVHRGSTRPIFYFESL